MADQMSPNAKGSKKKSRGIGKLFRDLIKRPNSAYDSAYQSNSTVSSASGAHHATDAGNAEPTASSSNAALNNNPTAPSQSARPSSSVPDLQESAVGQEEGNRKTSLTLTPVAGPVSTNTQPQTSNWKATAKEGVKVAGRFTETLLKKVPGCVSANPVQMAFSIAKVIIEIKDGVGSNKDGLVQLLERTANRLLTVESKEVSGKAAEEAMENFKKIIGEEMQKLKALADESLLIKVVDYEAYGTKIQQIFQQVEEATTSWFFEMTISIQQTASQIQDDTKRERLNPSEKADHRTVFEGHGLKREACTDGTRVKILEDITKWANDCSSASPRVFWLTGQAGSGKTTIAYTIAKVFEQDANPNQHTVLGGNFFCSRQFEETRAQTRILPTIAYQFARKCKSYADALHVADKFDSVKFDVATQLSDLLVGPWQQSESTRGLGPRLYLIVIDALDEIEGEGGSAFLGDLLHTIDKYDLRGLKFLVTSRSDPELVERCKAFTSEAVCRLQDVPIEEAKSDIRVYLKDKLKKLDGTPELTELERRADGLFIYAATAVKYLIPHRSITVGEQTEMLQNLLSKSVFESDATFLIDDLYRRILCDSFSPFKGKFLICRLRILYTFLCTAERTSASTVAALVPEGNNGVAKAVLDDLHAVLYSQDDRVFWYHASFPDFIFDPARSDFRIGEKDYAFSCNEPAHHNLLGESCFQIMKSGLRFNMGNIPSSFLFDSDNAVALAEEVNRNISAALRYSVRHWTRHLPLPQSIDVDNLLRLISDFLQICVLFWIEAMNLLGLRNQCTPMLQRAREWALKCGNDYLELARDIGEAANFATYFTGSPAAKSTPHLYISALATWSRNTSLSQKWKNQFTRIPAFTHTKGGIDLPLMTVSAGAPIASVAISSDEARIVSGSWGKSVQVWDASTGVQLKELNGHTRLVTSVAFSSDGTQIVSGSSENSVRVWDASTGVELKELKGHTDWVNSVAFSGDGTRIVSGSEDKSVRVWDASTGVELKALKGHTDTVKSVAFSRDGTQIASGSNDRSVRVWNASTGVQLMKLQRHTSHIASVAFSSDGARIVSGSLDCSVRVWNALTGAELKKLNGHTSPVTSVAFSSDGTQIVSGSWDMSVRVWDASTGVELKVLKGHTEDINSVAFSSDGTRIVSGSRDTSVRVWDVSTVVELKELKGHTDCIHSVAFSSDGTRIVSGSSDKSVRVWDALTGVQLKELEGHTNRVKSAAFSSDGTQIVSGSNDKSVRVWDASTGEELKELKGHNSYIKSVAFSSDGTRIVSGSWDRSVRVWDASSGVELKELNGHTHPVNSVAFSSDGTQIVSGSSDRSVRVWDASTGEELKELKGHNSYIKSVAFSSDGTRIVSGSDDEFVRVWDASTGVELKELKGHTMSVTSVAFSGDGTRIVSGSWDKSVRVWDASTGEELKELKGHTGYINSVAFSSDGTRIVSGSDDESVRVWNVSTPGILSDGDARFAWDLADSNWIISSREQNRLMWVPKEADLRTPLKILIISRSGFATVDFHQSMIGVDWVRCYTP